MLRRGPWRDGTILTRAVGFRDTCDEPELNGSYGFPEEELVGIYENDPGIEPALFVITDWGLRFPTTRANPIDYADIVTWRGPQSKVEGPREIVLTLRGGHERVLPVSRRHGPDGKFQDVYAVQTFIQDVVRFREWEPRARRSPVDAT